MQTLEALGLLQSQASCLRSSEYLGLQDHVQFSPSLPPLSETFVLETAKALNS